MKVELLILIFYTLLIYLRIICISDAWFTILLSQLSIHGI